jgi:UDP:flavonoid glycosyltransferase YjiC (YdhE family)
MRVLFTTWAWPSHYFPMVPLAWALRAAGHEVRMTSQPELLAVMLGSGLPATAVGSDLDVAAVHRGAMEAVRPARRGSAGHPRRRVDRVSEHLAGELDKADMLLLGAFLTLRELEVEAQSVFRTIRAERAAAKESNMSLYGEVAHAMVDDLLALARSWRPDLVVFDPLTYAGPLVAKLIGVPAVRNLFGPDVTYFTNAGEVLGLGNLLNRFGLDDLDLLGTASVDPCPPSLQFSDAIVPARRIRTRYIPYNGLSEVPRWLEEPPERPRICLTWGTSMARMLGDRAFLPSELLLGCAKLADERDADLVLAITAAQRDLLPELPPSVRVVESVPLQALLATCVAVIHQGGAGSMLNALVHGLPQIVLTQMPDQAANAIKLVTAGAGRTMAVAGLDASAVLAAGHDLLDDPAYRLAAQRLRQEMLEQPAPAAVIGELEALAGNAC